MDIPLSGAGTTGWVPVCTHLAVVGADVKVGGEVANAGGAVTGGWFSSPEAMRFLEVAFCADDDFRVTAGSFSARAFIMDCFFPAPGLDLGGIRKVKKRCEVGEDQRRTDARLYTAFISPSTP